MKEVKTLQDLIKEFDLKPDETERGFERQQKSEGTSYVLIDTRDNTYCTWKTLKDAKHMCEFANSLFGTKLLPKPMIIIKVQN